MNLLLRAFGNSKELTLKERAETILEVQQVIGKILQQDKWFILNKGVDLVDIKDKDASYPHILSQVKKGLNAKVINPKKYKEDDIPDISSGCNFYQNDKLEGLVVNYLLGYPSSASHGFMFGIEHLNLTKDQVDKIVEFIIKRFKPVFLSLVEYDFFYDIFQAQVNKLPWTGCFTYISNEVTNIDMPEKFKTKIIDNLGRIIYTSLNNQFDSYIVDRELALELEQFFFDNEIRIGKKKSITQQGI